MKNTPRLYATPVVGFAVLFFIAVIVAAHLAAPAAYSLTRNTGSDLGCQGYDRAWIMRAGFWVFGALMMAATGLLVASRTKFWPADAALALYGLGIFLTGVFSTAPFEAGIAYSTGQASLHSLFATLAGVMISLSMICSIFIDRQRSRKVFHIIAMVMVIGLSMLFGLAESGSIPVGQGLLQKTMWVFGLGWVFVNYIFLRGNA